MINHQVVTRKIVENFSELPLHTVTLMGLSFILGAAFVILTLVMLEHVRRGHETQQEE